MIVLIEVWQMRRPESPAC